jgi:transcriptional regulator with XRE-family HTH domain
VNVSNTLIGKRLAQARKELGLTQQAVADLCGFGERGQTLVYNIEIGKGGSSKIYSILTLYLQRAINLNFIFDPEEPTSLPIYNHQKVKDDEVFVGYIKDQLQSYSLLVDNAMDELRKAEMQIEDFKNYLSIDSNEDTLD